MKRILILISIAFLITSCNENLGAKAPDSKRMELDSESKYYDQNYRTYNLEDCEYIVVGAGRSQWGSHKGNCKNPIHTK